MLSPHNSDQHSSTLEEEDPAVQNIPRSINHLEQWVGQAQARIEDLNNLLIPYSELRNDFALPRTEVEAERNQIRASDVVRAKQMAESYLMRFRESERRCNQQSHRLTALETRVTMAESVCADQMRLNRELAEESVRTLRQFADAERRRIAIVKAANARTESLGRELNRYKNQNEQQEQAIVRLREQSSTLNQEATSLTQQLNKIQSEKNTIAMERDRFAHELQALRNQVSERDELLEELRDRELRMATELRERDALIESLGEERDRRDQELVRNRRDFQNLLAEKDRDIERLLMTKKKEVTAELKAKYRADIEEYKQRIEEQKKLFESGLKDALHEVQKLAAERETYHYNWRKLEDTLETHKLKLNAALKRKMVSKCAELVRDLNDVAGGLQNGGVASAVPRQLEPIENVAQRLLDGLNSQRGSGLS